MKSVLIAIQPYYVFLIIAKAMGWDIPQEKTVEVRKDYPKDPAWNKTVRIYCSKNRKSLNRIPKQYQPFMEKLLGKVVGEFLCNDIKRIGEGDTWRPNLVCEKACLKLEELNNYIKRNEGKAFYLWCISDLRIYDKPKELEEFRKPDIPFHEIKETVMVLVFSDGWKNGEPITRPPQSWCYVEEI